MRIPTNRSTRLPANITSRCAWFARYLNEFRGPRSPYSVESGKWELTKAPTRRVGVGRWRKRGFSSRTDGKDGSP